MELTFITNEIKNLEKIVNDYFFLFNKFNIKNLGLETINNLKIFINKRYLLIKDICNIKIINEKDFLIYFKKIEYLKIFNKINFFENYGFQIQKKKTYLELKIPKLSLEFRNNILKIIKNEYLNYKELLEFNRKKILINIKKKFKSIEEIKILEKKINNEIILFKKKLYDNFNKLSFKILNE